jgi:hypothetical protein
MARRPPSASQIRSQIRSAQRQAESKVRAEVRKLEREAESQMKRDVKKWERDTNRRLRAARPAVTYSVTERAYLGPVQEVAAEQAATHPERHDVFLCHAWDDRAGSAQELCDLLVEYGVEVWFSEKDVALGTSLLREIDRGLRTSRIGLVLVTPAMLTSLENEGVADKELSALLATERVIPVVHDTSFDALRDISPLLAARSGLSTVGSSLRDVAVKIANIVVPEE